MVALLFADLVTKVGDLQEALADAQKKCKTEAKATKKFKAGKAKSDAKVVALEAEVRQTHAQPRPYSPTRPRAHTR